MVAPLSAEEGVDAGVDDEAEPPGLAAKLRRVAGYQSPFSIDEYEKLYHSATTESGYTCAANLFWVQLFGSLTPSIPMDEDRIRTLIPLHFAKPGQFPQPSKIFMDTDKGE